MHQCLLSFCVHGALTKRNVMTRTHCGGRDVTDVPGEIPGKMDLSINVSLFYTLVFLLCCT